MPDPPIKPPNKGAENLLEEIENAVGIRAFDEKLEITIGILIKRIMMLEAKLNEISEK